MLSHHCQVVILGKKVLIGTGWLPPMPDLRDYTDDKEEVAEIVKKVGFGLCNASAVMKSEGNDGKVSADIQEKVPSQVDLRKWCSPIFNQGQIGSCTANAAVGIVEYYERRAFNKYNEGSRLFIYKVTRDLMRAKGDTGGYLRSAMGALVLCGVPDEKFWPYTDSKDAYDKEPPTFVYTVAENFKAIKYFSHDSKGSKTNPAEMLDNVKAYLAAGIPSMFGFYGFPSFEKSDIPGGIPFPGRGESAEWGHAVAAVGYDDSLRITNLQSGQATTGALLIRNSWGKEWGEGGYGWLPYDYVNYRLAYDFWSLVSMAWVDSNQFGF